MKKTLLIISLLQVISLAQTNGKIEIYNKNNYEVEAKKFEAKTGIKTDVKISNLELGADVQTKSVNILGSVKENSSVYLKLNYLNNYIKGTYRTKGETELEGNVAYEKYLNYNLQVKLPNNLKDIQIKHKLSSVYEATKSFELGANIVVNQGINSKKLEYKDLLFDEERSLNNGVLAHSYEAYGKYTGIKDLELESAVLYQNVVVKNPNKSYKKLWEQSAEYSLGVKKQTETYEKSKKQVEEKIKECNEKIKENIEIEGRILAEKNRIIIENNSLLKEIDALLAENKRTEAIAKAKEYAEKTKELKQLDKALQAARLNISENSILKEQMLVQLNELKEKIEKYKQESRENYEKYLREFRSQKGTINTHYFGTRFMAKYTGIKNTEFSILTVLGGKYANSKLEKYIKLEARAKYNYVINEKVSIVPEFVSTAKFTETIDAVLEPKISVNAKLKDNLMLNGNISTPINFNSQGYSNTTIKTGISLNYSW